jgi:FKBP-type peptidyl-prolyl cis-trans isomerase
MSTKNVIERPWVEFVLGINQVIIGFDRALPQMSVGERSKLTFSPEYACKHFLEFCTINYN